MTLCETAIAALHHFSLEGDYVRDDKETIAGRICSSSYFNGIGGDGIPVRAMSLHDSLAQILISKDSEEVIAVGSSLAEERLTLYVACNGKQSSLSDTKKQLESVWSRLKDIRRSVPVAPEPVGTSSMAQVQLHEQFRYFVYEHHALKLIKRFRKMDRMDLEGFFTQAMSTNSKFVRPRSAETEQGGSIAVIYEDEIRLVDCLAGVYRYIERYLKSLDTVDLRKLVHAIILAEYEFKEEGEKRGENIFTRREGRNFFFRCNLIVNEAFMKKKSNDMNPDAFRRFWQKAFSVEHAVEDLLRLPYSKRLGHLLDLDIEVVDVPAQRNVLKYDMENDAEFHKMFSTPENFREFMEKKKDKTKRFDKEVPTHCECTLLAYFVHNDIDAFEYIGVSKLSCTPCSWYFKACNKLTSLNKKFYTRGSHGKRYSEWTYARINRDIDKAIEEFLLSRAQEELASDLWRQRSGTDSTDASGPSVTFVEGSIRRDLFGADNAVTLRTAFQGADTLPLPQPLPQ